MSTREILDLGDEDPTGLIVALTSGPWRSYNALEDDEAIEWAVRRTFRGRVGFGGVAARFYDARTGWLDYDVRDEAEGGPGPLDGTDHPSMELSWSSFETLDLTCWEEGKLRVLRTYSIDTEGAEEIVREIGKPDRLDARPSRGPS